MRSNTVKYIDQIGREVQIPAQPERIVSLVPSQTELLFDLGLSDKIVGISKFCVHPEDTVHLKSKIGGTKKINSDKIDLLKPDLIIGNKEENVKEQIEALTEKYPVWLSDVSNLDDAIEMINQIGKITGTQQKADDITSNIVSGFDSLRQHKRGEAAYLIWKNPIMTVGRDTFIHDIMKRAGFTNAFSDKKRYPKTDIDELKKLKPAHILLSTEPFPFNEKHRVWFSQQLPDSKVTLVDGEYFSWYGSRLVKAIDYIKQL